MRMFPAIAWRGMAMSGPSMSLGPCTGQPKRRVQARIGASKARLRPILSRSSPMDKSGLNFC